MGNYQVEVSRIIEAPAEQIYELISDYHEGHPAILPSRYFTDMNVIEGGRGEGTAVTVGLNVFGTKHLYNMTVTEPEPGRILVEEDRSARVITTFRMDPFNGQEQTKVTISTTADTSPGLRGWLEKLVTPAITRRIYRQELDQLADVIRRKKEA